MSFCASDRYQLVRHLRSTETSQLYEARHLERPGRFLVETLPGARADEATWEALTREVEAMASLRHPGILRVHEVVRLADETPLLVSHLPEGATLADWLVQAVPMATDQALALVRGIADALEAAHARGVVHGDLRADDIHLVPLTAGAIGWPKVHGFGRRWLRRPGARAAEPRSETAASDETDPQAIGVPPVEERAADLAALARLAIRLLTPPEACRRDEGTGVWTNPAVAAVITRATGGGARGFLSPLEFASTLELAAWSEEPTPTPDEAAALGRAHSAWAGGRLTLTVVALGVTATVGGLLAAAETGRLTTFRHWLMDDVVVVAPGPPSANARPPTVFTEGRGPAPDRPARVPAQARPETALAAAAGPPSHDVDGPPSALTATAEMSDLDVASSTSSLTATAGLPSHDLDVVPSSPWPPAAAPAPRAARSAPQRAATRPVESTMTRRARAVVIHPPESWTPVNDRGAAKVDGQHTPGHGPVWSPRFGRVVPFDEADDPSSAGNLTGRLDGEVF